MKTRTTLAMLASAGTLAGCFVIKTDTFYEPARHQGERYDSEACGSINLNNSLEQFRGDAVIEFGVDRARDNPDVVAVYLTVYRTTRDARPDDGLVDIQKVRLNGVLPTSSSRDPGSTRWILRYDSVGPVDQVEVTFEAGAVRILGVEQPIAPLRFKRVRKTGVEFISINC